MPMWTLLNQFKSLCQLIPLSRRFGLGTSASVLSVYTDQYGHAQSRRTHRCVNGKGQPIPWYSYPAVEYLSQFDFSDRDVFEYGSGNSTLFWAARSKSVVTVEHDKAWHDTIKASMPANVELRLRPETDPAVYANTIGEEGPQRLFDVIIDDASHRNRCAKVALPYLKPGGLFILDNSDWFPNTAAWLRAQDLIQIDFCGFAPINHYTQATSIFMRRDIRLKPKTIQPVPPMGSIPCDDSNPDPVSI
jgi:hypothetical protein